MTARRPRPRLILHVGAYKTATSTLQSLFSLHEDDIAGRFGIHYPHAFRRVNSGVTIAGHPKVDSFAHHTIAHHVCRWSDVAAGRATATAMFGELAADFRASDCRSAFISTELLSFCNREQKEFILGQLGGFDVEVVYAVRNPVDYVESMNNQALKSGDRLRVSNAKEPHVHRLPFLENIEDWVALVGREKVHVLSFSSAYFEPFCRRFLEVFGDAAFSEYAMERMPRTNSSISAEGARVRLMFNRHLPRPKDMAPRKRHMVTRIVGEIAAELSRNTPLVTLDTAERRRILENHRGEIDAICDRFLPRELWHTLMTPERGVIASRTRVEDVALFSGKDLDHIVAGLLQSRRLFADQKADEAAAPAENGK